MGSRANWLDASSVAIVKTDSKYPEAAPFHPSTLYPEYPFSSEQSEAVNSVYPAVRELFLRLGFDEERHGTAAWNPLGELISPGNTVLLKPNMITGAREDRPDEWQQLVTNGAVIRAVLDYVFIALRGKGRIIVADGPQTDSDYDQICERMGLKEIASFFKRKGIGIELRDLRRDRWLSKDSIIYERLKLPGDPAGYTTVELGDKSEFKTYSLNGHFFGADYDIAETASYHSNGRHAYVFFKTVMDADVMINLPKLKTHKKVGVTLSLKNMVGIIGYRNCLPHHTIGTPDENGDEFPQADMAHKLQSRLNVWFKRLLVLLGNRAGAWARLVRRSGLRVFGHTNKVVRSGNWYGNDTCWRMVLDLNKSLFYFDGSAERRSKSFKYLSVVDGIVAGDGNGPSDADARPEGIVVAGCNPAAVDTVCATIMGFDYHNIKQLERVWQMQDYPLASFRADAIQVNSSVPYWNVSFSRLRQAPHLGFRAQFGWTGQIERPLSE